jgi:hypothetical protein
MIKYYTKKSLGGGGTKYENSHILSSHSLISCSLLSKLTFTTINSLWSTRDLTPTSPKILWRRGQHNDITYCIVKIL